MTGRAEVARLKQRLDATFERVKEAGPDLELRSDFARYLCVLVSGYLERAVIELLLEHARGVGGPSLQRFVELRTARFSNANAQRIQELLGSFDPEWQILMNSFLIDDLKDAIDGLVRLRNKIAHGESVGVTYQRISDYYARVQRVVERIAEICVPN